MQNHVESSILLASAAFCSLQPLQAPVLLFLHADTDLPEGAIAAIQASHIRHIQEQFSQNSAVMSCLGQAALGDTGVMGGCFELRFHEEDQSWTLQLWSSLERISVNSTCSLNAWPVLDMSRYFKITV